MTSPRARKRANGSPDRVLWRICFHHPVRSGGALGDRKRGTENGTVPFFDALRRYSSMGDALNSPNSRIVGVSRASRMVSRTFEVVTAGNRSSRL